MRREVLPLVMLDVQEGEAKLLALSSPTLPVSSVSSGRKEDFYPPDGGAERKEVAVELEAQQQDIVLSPRTRCHLCRWFQTQPPKWSAHVCMQQTHRARKSHE